MSARALLAPLLVAGVLGLAGWGAAARLAIGRGSRAVVAFLAGAVLLHVVLATGDALGVGWSVPVALAALAVATLASLLHRRGAGSDPASAGPAPPQSWLRTPVLGWGDALAALAVLTFAALAWTRWVANPDFVYHWGLKAHRFLLAGGVDYGYLGRPWSWVLHPDYPNLFPELLSATSWCAGAWDECGLLLWSPLLLLLTLAVMRETLAAHGVTPARRQAVIAAAAFALAGFGIGHFMAGAADWLPAVALAAALPALLAPAEASTDAHLGICAAFAAAAKIEAVALAALLVLVQLGRHALGRRRPALSGLLALTVPPLLVIAPWVYAVAAHGLYQPGNAGAPGLRQILRAAPALWQAAATPAWNGMPYLLLLLPLLFRVPRLRPFATVATLQLAFDLLTYVVSPFEDVGFLVLASFARLVLHLLPATLAAAAIAWLAAPPPEAAAPERAPLATAASAGGGG